MEEYVAKQQAMMDAAQKYFKNKMMLYKKEII